MTELELQVVNSLTKLASKYQLLDELTESMVLKQQQGKPFEKELESMQCQREELIQMELESRPANEAYRQANTSASERVRQLTQQTTVLIQNVIEKIATLEQSARASYRQLIPEIDQTVRGTQMKQAYGKTS